MAFLEGADHLVIRLLAESCLDKGIIEEGLRHFDGFLSDEEALSHFLDPAPERICDELVAEANADHLDVLVSRVNPSDEVFQVL